MNIQHYTSYTVFLILSICSFILNDVVYGAETHKGVVIFTRHGIVIELEAGVLKTDRASLQIEITSGQPPKPLTSSTSLKSTSSSGDNLQWIDDRRFFKPFDWKSQKTYHIKMQWRNDHQFEADVNAPHKPVPYRVRTIELGNLLLLLANLQCPAKPTTVALSPDGEQLAIATDAGHLAIIHPLTGKEIWKTRISEGYAKHATFSHDGVRFYIGEQSADGFIYGYDLSDTKPALLWKYRMADDIDTSTPQNSNDVYAWVQYPGPYRIIATSDGDLLVVGNHSWTEGEVSVKKAQFYRFDGKTGNLKWKWPRNQVLPMTISWFDYSRDATTIVLLAYGKGSKNSAQFKPGTLSVINGATGAVRWSYTFDPLNPYFKEVTFWRGVSVSPDGRFINVLTDDGRAFIFDAVESPDGRIEPLWQTPLTTPLEISGIPITATSGTLDATNDYALFVTGDTYIPYHMQKGAQQPPSAHPNGRTLFAYSWVGEKVWEWKLENMPQGLRVDAEGRYAAISISKRGGNVEEQLHGVSLFNLGAEGSGLAKYLYTYRTEGQLLYDTIDISETGRFITLIETPIVLPDETLRGKNRVHIIQ